MVSRESIRINLGLGHDSESRVAQLPLSFPRSRTPSLQVNGT
jgi:hypothetical protein